MASENFDKLNDFLSGDGGKKARSGASLLPAPVSPAWYDVDSKEWYGEKDLTALKKKERSSLVQCSLFVQYSPTARAGCRRCGEKIEKDVLRLGYPFRWRASEDPYTLYLHPECYVPEVFGIKEKELPSKILGYKALSNTEKAQLWKAMRSEGKDRTASSEGKAATTALSTNSVGTVAKIPPVKVPKEITIPMLPFQREGLAWMCNQEETAAGGGILADEMGMGKTIQAIALLVAKRLDGPALVVVPMAAVSQWVSEITRFTTKNTLRTYVYHGAQRSRLLSDFKKADVVITTYQTLESDYRIEANKLRVACKWCKKLFMPEKLKFHQKYFCGPDAVRTLKQQRTQKKDQASARKAISSMGIGEVSQNTPPTITNIYKSYMKEAGVDIKSSGYWNVRREAAELNRSGASSSSSSRPPKGDGPDLSRERLALLDRSDIQELCAARGLDTTGRKPDLIDRLKDFEVRGMTKGGNTTKPSMAARLVAAAKAKSKAKAKAAKTSANAFDAPTITPAHLKRKSGSDASSKYQGVSLVRNDKWQATHCGKYLGVFATELQAARAICDHANGCSQANGSKKGKAAMTAPKPSNGLARTVASQRAASSNSKDNAKGKGVKRTHEVMEGGDGEVEYQTYEGGQMDLSGSPLHAMVWSRIILDEAHRIKGRTNSTALAAYALQSTCHKWCLSGTPLQNRIGELYSLIRFLRIRPFAFYYCKKKGCNCECARFMRDRYCPNCGHVRFLHYSHFKREVSNPIIKYGYMGAGKSAFNTLRGDILGKTMLRRTKEERKADLKLPPIKTMIRKDTLSKQEMDFYSSLYKQSCVQFDTYVKGGTILHNYAHIFDLLTSLRRAVDHPYLIVHGGGSASHKLPNGEKLQPKLGVVCGLCQDDIIEDGEEVKRTASCGHSFHDECIRDYIADAPKLKCGGVGCPVCFTKLSIDLGSDNVGSDDEAGNKASGSRKKSSDETPKRPRSRSRTALITPPKTAAPRSRVASPAKTSKQATTRGIMQKIRASEFQSSTKIEALLDEVRKMMKSDKTAKAIVFSQYGAMLELVEFALKREGISCVVFRGGMSMQARDDALGAFNSDASLKVILISLKAGGEGLNLQVANHVFLLDPWWNPACELQAIQRAHRIGQTKEVKAIRFITKNTIEEKIIALQEKKQLVFDASIDGSSASLGKLTQEDVRFLFQH
mmetsp:Transcript_56102/g.88937  ORF Transcript_56102/g.88937 Transcript_56102/m.88937 type:complete len:1185 (-) Transcript_56102:208-3762(-)|eukprot:CAMPEP_0169097716 /NCGR_PEP_ID=MMETSP1015-20121227/19662_1 /TAXON_ID=342587 /ORGANISM="Karlodinium micrum, Strain CCMP2283" /LENGTH=1184 /DNA_ID=CAMNT_0009158529 /DNA_START=30 /DNA_END=3584 /DNA_ORIENTATION=-